MTSPSDFDAEQELPHSPEAQESKTVSAEALLAIAERMQSFSAYAARSELFAQRTLDCGKRPLRISLTQHVRPTPSEQITIGLPYDEETNHTTVSVIILSKERDSRHWQLTLDDGTQGKSVDNDIAALIAGSETAEPTIDDFLQRTDRTNASEKANLVIGMLSSLGDSAYTGNAGVEKTDNICEQLLNWLKDDIAATATPWAIKYMHEGSLGGNQVAVVAEMPIPSDPLNHTDRDLPTLPTEYVIHLDTVFNLSTYAPDDTTGHNDYYFEDLSQVTPEQPLPDLTEADRANHPYEVYAVDGVYAIYLKSPFQQVSVFDTHEAAVAQADRWWQEALARSQVDRELNETRAQLVIATLDCLLENAWNDAFESEL